MPKLIKDAWLAVIGRQRKLRTTKALYSRTQSCHTKNTTLNMLHLPVFASFPVSVELLDRLALTAGLLTRAVVFLVNAGAAHSTEESCAFLPDYALHWLKCSLPWNISYARGKYHSSDFARHTYIFITYKKPITFMIIPRWLNGIDCHFRVFFRWSGLSFARRFFSYVCKTILQIENDCSKKYSESHYKTTYLWKQQNRIKTQELQKTEAPIRNTWFFYLHHSTQFENRRLARNTTNFGCICITWRFKFWCSFEILWLLFRPSSFTNTWGRRLTKSDLKLPLKLQGSCRRMLPQWCFVDKQMRSMTWWRNRRKKLRYFI